MTKRSLLAVRFSNASRGGEGRSGKLPFVFLFRKVFAKETRNVVSRTHRERYNLCTFCLLSSRRNWQVRKLTSDSSVLRRNWQVRKLTSDSSFFISCVQLCPAPAFFYCFSLRVSSVFSTVHFCFCPHAERIFFVCFFYDKREMLSLTFPWKDKKRESLVRCRLNRSQ